MDPNTNKYQHPDTATNLAAFEQFVRDTSPFLSELGISNIPGKSEKFAVIIEPRIHVHLEYVLRNIMYFLGADWGLQIFAGRANSAFVSNLVRDWGDVHIYTLDVDNLTRKQFRKLRRTAAFWETMQGEYLLCFETDSILCRRGIDEFLDYDYIGAPWHEMTSPSPRVRVGNGGLSLRRKSVMQEICETVKVDHIASEDVFFSIHLQLNADRYKVAPMEVAERFSVETMFHPHPLGIHKAWCYLPETSFRQILDTIHYTR